MGVITLTGSNSFLITQEIDQNVALYIEENGPMGVERIDADTVTAEEVIQRITSPSLFVQNRLILLRDVSRNKDLSDAILSFVETPQEQTKLIIIERSLDARSRLYKGLKKYSDFKEFNELRIDQLASWLRTRVDFYGGSISVSDALYLVERSGAKQQLLDQEVQKLVIYKPEISRQSIDLLVEPGINSKSFDVAAAAFSGNTKEAVRIYFEQRALKVDPLLIIGSLAWQLHLLVLVKSAGSRENINNDSGINPWSLDKAFALARKINYSQLVAAIDRLIVIDSKCKSVDINADDALIYFLLSI